MIRLTRFAVENKHAIVFTAVLLALAGFYLMFQIPQGVFPEADYPRIQVLVDYGLAPLQQMEAEIVKPIEETVMMIPGVEAVRSTTNRGSSEIDIHFGWKEDMFKAYQLVQAQMGGIQNQLPQGIELNIRRINNSTFPIASYSLYSKQHSLLELWESATYTIRPQLADIPGIYNIEIVGGEQREYRVILDPYKLAAYKLDHNLVADAIQKTNSVEFVGRLNEHNKLYLNIADNRYQTMADIGKTVIADYYPTPLRLVDIAKIEPAYRENFVKTRSNFEDAVLINIVVQPGVNSVDVMKNIEARLVGIRKSFPPAVEMHKWYDLTDFTKDSISSVYQNIFLGAGLTILILLLFLRRLRITLVTAVIIPVALLITFIPMKLTGMDLNLMSLGGLAASIGILVNNAIVVVENVERFLEEGFPRTEAVVKATAEIIAPLIGATLTTLVVFIPLIFLGGVPGIFFGTLAGILAITIVISMLLAMFLTPALAESFVSEKRKLPGKVLPHLVNIHERVLKFSLGQPALMAVVILLLAAVTILFYLKIPSGFLPEWDEGTIVLDFRSPPGSSVDGSYSMLKTIEDHFYDIPEVADYSLRIGTSLGHPRMHANEGDFLISLKKERNRSVFEIMDELRQFSEKVEPRLEVELFQVLPDRLNSDLAGEIAPIAVRVFGNNLSTIQETAQHIASVLENIPNVVDVYRGFNPSEPEINIQVLTQIAAHYGLSVADVNNAVRMALWGQQTTNVIDGLKIIPVQLRYDKQNYNHLKNIKRLPIYLPAINRVVNLEEIAKIVESPGLTDLEDENLSLVVNVSARISGRDLGSIVRDVKIALKSVTLPPGVSIQLGGAYESQQEAFNQLLMILFFGALMVLTILLFEFRSFSTAVITIIGTILALSGVFLSLWVTSIPLDISAFMGMIMIIGVVVNNGILVIDFAELYLKESHDVREALLAAGRVRLRPVLMTTLATIMGFLPLSLALGTGSEMLQPLAVSMIGGMSLSLFLSLVVIPTLYYWVKG